MKQNEIDLTYGLRLVTIGHTVRDEKRQFFEYNWLMGFQKRFAHPG